MKQIDGFPDYWVSSLGFVYSEKSKKFLSPTVEKDGYHVISLRNIEGKKIQKRIHRLVAFAYLLKDSNRDQVNHKNGIKTDNSLGNLEWCTCKENNQHARATGLAKPTEVQLEVLKGYAKTKRKLDDSIVSEVRRLLALGCSCYCISNLLKIHSSTIGGIKNNILYKEVGSMNEISL